MSGALFDFGSPLPSDALSRRCAEVLTTMAKGRGLAPGLSGSTVTFSMCEVVLRARIEARQNAPGRTVVSVAVDTAIAAQAGITVGSVGVGRDEADATETAIQEWSALVVPALLGAVALGDRASERYTIDGYIAYPGATGFRGAQIAWGSAEHERLLAALRRALPLPVPGRVRAITLTVMVESGQMPQGDVRFDGVVAPPLWAAVQLFDWPRAASGYIFKQFYLLAPMGERR